MFKTHYMKRKSPKEVILYLSVIEKFYKKDYINLAAINDTQLVLCECQGLLKTWWLSIKSLSDISVINAW